MCQEIGIVVVHYTKDNHTQDKLDRLTKLRKHQGRNQQPNHKIQDNYPPLPHKLWKFHTSHNLRTQDKKHNSLNFCKEWYKRMIRMQDNLGELSWLIYKGNYLKTICNSDLQSKRCNFDKLLHKDHPHHRIQLNHQIFV
jgi:hypothetical protein